MALKFLNDSGSGSTADAIEAVQYATNKGVLARHGHRDRP
jgi:hypothetical protein